MYDILIICGVNFAMLLFGATVNCQFAKDKIQLAQLKQTLVYIKVNISTVMNPAYNVPDG